MSGDGRLVGFVQKTKEHTGSEFGSTPLGSRRIALLVGKALPFKGVFGTQCTGPCFAQRVHDEPEEVVIQPLRMVVKVTNNDTQDLPFRSVVRNANRILSVLGASRRQKSDPRNGPNAKPLYHGILGGRSRLGGDSCPE